MSTPPAAPATGGPDDRGEISVHHCTVKVVRRGGWSWGPDPGDLVRQVTEAIPRLLERRFAAHLTGDGPDVEITEPLTVTVRAGAGGLASLGTAAADVHFAPVPVTEVRADEPGAHPVSFEDSFVPQDLRDAPSPVDLFHELAERDELDALLALLPDSTVRAFLLALLSDGSERTDDEVTARLFAELAGRARPDALAEALPDELLSALAGADPAQLPRFLVAYVASTDRAELVRLAQTLPERSAAPARDPARDPAPRTAGTPATKDVRVWSALPFLLAGPLARIGYLDALGPALAGVELADEAPVFAAALAYKVLGATGRGWRRTERDTEAAAAFAGLVPPVDEERLTAFARLAPPALPALDGVLALAVGRGHDPAQPLLLGAADGGLLLLDAQGLFPVAWADRATELLPHWRTCGRPPVLLCDSAPDGGTLPAGTLRELAAHGVPFLTGVRPLRGDPVTRLPWRTPLWTAADEQLTDPRLAVQLPEHTARFADLVTALTVDRRAVPLAADCALERTVTLAAALGLATVAWTLWRDRETPDPLLALRRFADLEATVRFDASAVRVRVPMGRRHADLERGGLLRDVPDVVWLGGRTLTFSGG
ncbi:hypothetical protein [Streptomyces sp. NPDC050504]|uniref:hypothetical protein n=1 Tax=Streptomyces sp. NPDC050504 TaxID=3365618 RepID=UPI00378EE80B